MATIFRPAPRSIAGQAETPGFPVIIEGVVEPIIDPVLDDHVAQTVWGSLRSGFAWKAAIRTRAREDLVRAVALLRSNLDGEDLALPRRPTVRHFAVLKLGFISAALFIAILIVTLNTAEYVGPTGFALWPIFGVLLAFWHPMLVRRELRDDPSSRPFLTVAQYESNASLVSAEEQASFVRDIREHQRSMTRTSQLPKSRWRFVRTALDIALGSLITLSFVGLIAGAFLALWPYFLFDVIRTAKLRSRV